MKYAIIGCGTRIAGLSKRLNEYEDVSLVGGYDPSEGNVKRLLLDSGADNGTVYDSYEALLADETIDWVLIGSPNHVHREHIISSFEAGKHVFSEKPIATTIEDLKYIKEAADACDRLFATGFTLRYATIYREAKRILSSGMLGEIVAINATENIKPEHGAYIMRNWRRKKEYAGPHILEKCVHDLDILNWMTDSYPVSIQAIGGNKFFVEKNADLYGKYRDDLDQWKEDETFRQFDQGNENPFLSDKTIEDQVMAIMEYDNGIQVQFQATTSNIMPERRLYVTCTEGNLLLELYSGMLRYQHMTDDEPTDLTLVGGGHGDGDEVIIRELRESMLEGTDPVCSGEEGLRSAVAALGIEKARLEGCKIDLNDVWRELGVK